jgi:hypothetical protein
LLAGLDLSLAGFSITVGLSCGLERGGSLVNTLSLLSTLEQFLHLGVGSFSAKDGTKGFVVEVDGQANQEGILDGGSLNLIDLTCMLASDLAHTVVHAYI